MARKRSFLQNYITFDK